MPRRFLKPLASLLLNTYANAYGKPKEKSKRYLLLARKMGAINFYWNPKTCYTKHQGRWRAYHSRVGGFSVLNQKKITFNIIPKQSSRNSHEPFHLFFFSLEKRSGTCVWHERKEKSLKNFRAQCKKCH